MAKAKDTDALEANYVPEILTDDELEKQSANVQATLAAKAEAVRLEREAYLAPAVAVASTAGLRDLLSGLRGIHEQYAEDPQFGAHITALVNIIAAFANAVGVNVEMVTAPSTDVDPEA